jgi:hypothetical protein
MIARWTALLLALGLLGCARHVVVSAERAANLNDTDWRVHSAPDAGAGR